MQSTFSGIEIGKKGIVTHQAALGVTGHNLTNAETEGYSRQKVTFQVFDPLYLPGLTREMTSGQIGQGVKIEKILRARDLLLEDRILSEKNILSYWRSMSDWIRQVELVHNEPSGYGILNALDRFWASWQELANNPEEIAPREAVRESGEALSISINQMYMALKSIRDNIEQTISVKVEEVNSLARQIAELNKEILRAESTGDNPNDLWDRRDLLVEKLSRLVNVSISRGDRDEFIIYVGGRHLVQGAHFEQINLRKNPQNEGYSDIIWNDGQLLNVKSGELRALLDARDIDLKNQIHDLDTLAITIIDSINSIHRRGFGLNLKTGIDFFTEKSIAIDRNGNFDSNRDGFIDGTAIFRIIGNKQLSPDDVLGVSGTISLGNGITVDYTPTDTVADVIKKVNNSDSDIRMYINSDEHLVVKSYSRDFLINHLEDSGDFLVQFSGILNQSGPGGAFDSGSPDMYGALAGDFMVGPSAHPSLWMGINDVLKHEVESIAASTGTDTDGDGIPDLSAGAGNGDNALKIANVRFNHIMVGGKTTINEFYQGIISKIGLRGETAGNAEKNLSMIVENLEKLRDSISGVSIDEELVNLVKFQHGYAAAARFITEVNKMLEILINRMI